MVTWAALATQRVLSVAPMPESDVESRLDQLIAAGVHVIDPRQTYVAPDVDLERIAAGAVLHPGVRLQGSRTLVAPGARVGTEGPATLVDTSLGRDVTVASGFLDQAVLLDGAKAGAQAHFRAGTLLEEQASTAHCVGLKQTILLSFVTLGSLINFCDCLMAGGTSRSDHSEVGSGFIHFNFTPWGARGDKATASLVGDVARGVFLREPRIFLGGSGGMVGPRMVGYGAISGAGQVLRGDVARETLTVQALRSVKRKLSRSYLDPIEPRARKNVAFIAHLVALRAWYREVRLLRAESLAAREPAQAWRVKQIGMAIALIEGAIDERHERLRRFVEERGGTVPPVELEGLPARPDDFPIHGEADLSHIDWVAGLDDAAVDAGRRWLAHIVNDVGRRLGTP